MSDFDMEDDDELDELFNYDIDKINTTFDANKATDDQQTTTANKGKGKTGSEDLGVDEEIKIRTRKPKVKLTEDRLLGPNGIPYLQENAAKKIKFKGKGHEISDLERLLKFYQIWADNLYPKAQFKDAIDMIEKLGSSRGMQRRREEWIEDFKKARAGEDDRLIMKARDVLRAADGPRIDAKGRTVLRIPDPSKKPEESGSAQEPREGSQEAQREDLNVQGDISGGNNATTARKDNVDSLFFEDDDEDDLDEILKEVDTSRGGNPVSGGELGDDELDELEAIMRDMEESSGPKSNTGTGSRVRNVIQSDDEFEDAMEAMREAER
ncbi:chromosome segregation in meiosis- protein [Orbilia blumenaviensis]|uniref:Chromosome segregation in meiosis protein n=1 Tax=Orbilia blumenaviensis TaxID=1796055 RepID=A0AAV9VAB6_9PEZI